MLLPSRSSLMLFGEGSKMWFWASDPFIFANQGIAVTFVQGISYNPVTRSWFTSFQRGPEVKLLPPVTYLALAYQLSSRQASCCFSRHHRSGCFIVHAQPGH